MGEQRTALILLLILFSLFFSVPEIRIVNAEPKTIVVPDDYSTITAAIGNASEGDTVFVKEGTYEEHSLVINKTLTLTGEDASTTIIKTIDTPPPWDPSLNPFPPPPIIAVQINASNVKVSNFTITRALGVFADGSEIVDNFVESTSLGIIMNSNNNTIARNSLSGTGSEGFIRCTGSYNSILENKINGIVSSTFGAVYIKGSFNSVYSNAITDTSSFSYGRIKVYGDENSITKNNLTNGEIRIDGSENMVRANNVAVLVVLGYNNTFTANNISHALSIYINENDTADHTFYHNNFIANPGPSITFSDWTQGHVFFDNGREGNYWSDYNGTDNDGDGVGDTPYIIGFNRKDNYPLMAPITIFDAGTWEWTQYNVDVISNSTLSDFTFNPENTIIEFNVVGESGTSGFCRVTIPKELLYADETEWVVLVDNSSVTPTVNEDESNTYLYFTYKHSAKMVEIIGTTAIPESLSWTPLLIALVAVVVVAVVYRRKLQNRVRWK